MTWATMLRANSIPGGSTRRSCRRTGHTSDGMERASEATNFDDHRPVRPSGPGPTSGVERLTALEPGMAIVYGGDRIARVPADLAAAFQPGDRILVVAESGAILHIPNAEHDLVSAAVSDAHHAFGELASISDTAISAFFDGFAALLDDDASFGPIAEANALDVTAAKARGRSTTRLALSAKMRADMIAGLRGWRDTPSTRDAIVETVEHDGWRVEQRRAGLGVVGFVFEGRPNVFADATGVLRSGNTVVFRIGSDALETARAIVDHALVPALRLAGLPEGAARLLDSPARATGWALFSDPRVGLAVARGSGSAVEQLGSVARQAGIPASLHGTGGAWMVAGRGADIATFSAAVEHSLDRKVCNTLNVCCILEEHADTFVPAFLTALESAARQRGTNPKLHVVAGAQRWTDPAWLTRVVPITRAEGIVEERQAQFIAEADLGTEWEWEESPEVSLVVVPSVQHAIELNNRHSPRLVASLISDDPDEQASFWQSVDVPFVGNGFTRWVDGQFALDRPELGLSNWGSGRLFGRSAVLSGDSVFTIRTRAVQHERDLHR